MFGIKLKGKDGLLSKYAPVSKQVLTVWQQTVTEDISLPRKSLAILAAVAIHALLLTLTSQIRNASTETAVKSERVSVRLAPAQNKSPSNPVESQTPHTERHDTAKKKIQILTSQPDKTQQLESEPFSTFTESPVSAPNQVRSEAKSSLLEERRSPILPSGSADFIERQRNLGDTIGAGAIAGDLEIPDVVSEQDPTSPIRKTEFTFAGYFDSLSRRFIEAWGGVRTLPAQSQFEGKIGEFIEYDVVINRDGSLRKIVNVTARKEPYRDFTAVDELVMGVFKGLFPFQPVPDRIRNDPLVIRKRIQFVGFKYTLY